MSNALATIDLSRLRAPEAIETLSFEALQTAFVQRFLEAWNDERQVDPALPVYDVSRLESDPIVIVGQAFSYLRLLDRQRVNDVVRAVLAPLASGANLDHVVARQNVQRLIVRPATSTVPGVMESDEALLRRYLLSFDRASAGSRDRFLYEAWTAWPEMHDARVNGHRVHQRPGYVDIVISGPDGAAATPAQKALVSAAVCAPNVQPEAVSVAVLDAVRAEYSVDLVIEIPTGPDSELVRLEAEQRVWAAGNARMLIGGEVPAGYLAGAAYGASIIRVRDNAPVAIEPDPYTIPILVGVDIATEVRT